MMKRKSVYVAGLCFFAVANLMLSCSEQHTETNSNNKNGMQNDSLKSSKTTPEWAKNSTMYEVNIRQFTPEGTFKAFEAHLPRLKDMGVDILWFMPVNPIGEKNRKGTRGSHYSVKNYNALNPEYGTFEEFKALVAKIHEMGMYVLIDWVANHSAWDNVWVKEHPEYYTKDTNGNFVPPVTDWTDVIDLNYDNPDLRRAMTDALIFWVKEADIDGFRCDVADMVPTDFWNNARAELDIIKPVFMLAEAEKGEMHEKAFDMTYSWKLLHLMNDIAKKKKYPAEISDVLEWEKTEFPEEAFRMRFTSNHDENSWNGTVFERYGEGARTFAVLVALLPGMPLVYGGQESALKKRLSFFEKDSIQWSDYRFSDFYTTLLTLKKRNRALWNGSYGGSMQIVETPDSSFVFAFIRKNEDSEVLVVLNLSADPVTVSLVLNPGTYTDVFYNRETVFDGKEDFALMPWEYRVYEKKK
ncbi:MAG: alpha-glucosidase C-terminal domain-containing protein [Bacteroidetes bacterium]|nr:alpha-glucosidase C-terminal domain-containing protein [Bacteroidota bacterium]